MKPFRRKLPAQPRPVARSYKPSKSKWKTAGRWLLKKVTLASIAIAVAVLLAGVYIWRETTREVLIIEPFSVPKRLEEAGITPDVMANRVGDAMRQMEMEDNVNLTQKDSFGAAREEEAIPDIQIPGTKFGLKSVIEIVREIFHRYPKRITGDIMLPLPTANGANTLLLGGETGEATVTIVISEGRERGVAVAGHCASNDISKMAETAAELALRQTNPLLFALYKYDNGDREIALAIAQSMIIGSQSDARHRALGHDLLGRDFNDRGKHDEAAAEVEKAIEIDPDLGFSHLLAGMMLLNDNDYEEAIEEYKKAAGLNPRSPWGVIGWARTLWEEKKYPEANAKFEEATKIDSNDPNAFVEWGKELSGQEAVAKYKRAIEADPEDTLAYVMFGDLLYEQKDYDQAYEIYSRAAAIATRPAAVYSFWGVNLGKSGRYHEAANKFAKAVELEPGYSKAYDDWGWMLENEERNDEAVAKFKKATEVDPKNKLAFKHWDSLLMDEGEKGYAERIDKLEKIIAIDPEDADAYDSLGYVLYAQGKYDAAIEKFEAITEMSPPPDNLASAYMEWGDALHRKGKDKDSDVEEKYEKAVKVSPKYGAIYDAWGIFLYDVKKYDDAAKKFQVAVKLNPYGPYYVHWGMTLYALGNYDQAAVVYEWASREPTKLAEGYEGWARALKKLGRNAEAQEVLAKEREWAGRK